MAQMDANYVSEIVSKSRHVRDLLTALFLKEKEKTLFKELSLSRLVPMALGKYLFPFRTQKSSPVAAIILRLRETSKVPNYGKTTRKGGFFYLANKIVSETTPKRSKIML